MLMTVGTACYSYLALGLGLVLSAVHCLGASAERGPGTILQDVLSKPFAPSDWSSEQCLRDSATYSKELGRFTPWALKMYDASTKLPSGVITGNYKQLGNYDECLDVRSEEDFIGQACSVSVQFEVTLSEGGAGSAEQQEGSHRGVAGGGNGVGVAGGGGIVARNSGVDDVERALGAEEEEEEVGVATAAASSSAAAAAAGAAAGGKGDMSDLLVNVALASVSKKNATEWSGGDTVIYEWLWCVPSSCNHSEVQETLEIALDPLKVEGRLDFVVSVGQDSCHTYKTDRVPFDRADWAYVSVLGFFAILIVASTCYDLAMQRQFCKLKKKDRREAALSSFSVYSNGRNLLEQKRHRDSIGCLDGLRYLSICWIIFGHTYYNEVVGVKLDLTQVPRMHLDWSAMLVLNGNIVTDTFFLLSGLLLAYTELMKKEKESGNWRFRAVGLYLHRYLRLTPAYAMMIGFYATLFHKMGTGPHWNSWVGSNRKFCRENWWTNLLYVNNYVNVPSMCMSQSWYLATDMQLVWLSPIFLYPMLKYGGGLFFWLLSSLGLLLSMLLPFILTYSLSLTGTMLYYKEQSMLAKVYTEIYTRVYNRFGPYVIGLILGYTLWKTRKRTLNIPRVYIICGWLLALSVGLLVIFGPRGMYFDAPDSYDRLEASFYAGLHRHGFAFAVSWIIWSCVHGYAGPVDAILSWKGWIPLSRLSYTAYLSHYLFLLSDSGSVRTSSILTTMLVVRKFFANLCLTMILSVVWSLCFEMPFMKLERALNVRRNQQHQRQQHQEEQQQQKSAETSISTEQDKIFDPPDSAEPALWPCTSTTLAHSSNEEILNAHLLRECQAGCTPPEVFLIGPALPHSPREPRDPRDPSQC